VDDPVGSALASAADAVWVARHSTEAVRYDLARAAVMAFLRALPNSGPAELTVDVDGVAYWKASALMGAVARAEVTDGSMMAQKTHTYDSSMGLIGPPKCLAWPP
jgi:hypothetical protein